MSKTTSASLLAFTSIFGKEQSHIYELLESLAEYADGQTYHVMNTDTYKELVNNHASEAQRVYWRELTDRTHFAATSSAIRHFRWLNGCLDGFVDQNFQIFCAGFRGLLESAADSFEALYRLPMYFAKNGHIIKGILGGIDTGNTITIAPQVEESLIHFSHARSKKNLDSTSPKIHQARTVREYLDILKRGQLSHVYDCYGELCELTHPSAFSVLSFVDATESNDGVTWRINKEMDKGNTLDFISRYEELTRELMMFLVNPILLTAYVLDKVDANAYKCGLLSSVQLEKVPLFRNIQPFVAKWIE